MPGGFPFLGGITMQGALINASATTGGSNTKGAWVQVIGSTPIDYAGLLYATLLANANVGWSVDIGIGAAGSETIIAPDLTGYSVSSTVFNGPPIVQVPFIIPAGTRIAARGQASAASQSLGIHIWPYSGSFLQSQGGAMDAIGFIAANSRGTGYVCGNGSKGSYTQLIASTPYDYIGFFALPDYHNAVAAADNITMDLAIGASGAEVIILQDWYWRTDTTMVFSPGMIPFLPIPIPAGSRLSVRGQSGIGTPTYGLTLYGVR